MKVQTIITDITHDDLVNLFATATEGSNIFDVKKKKTDYYGTPLESETDCREDTWAKVLLAGKPVFVYDYCADDSDEFYGNLPHEWRPKTQAMRYELTLENIRKGLERALGSQTYIAKYAQDVMDDEAVNFDLTEAEGLLQYIVFGEEIYG